MSSFSKLLAEFKNDFSWSAFVAGFVVVLVGMSSSSPVVFQAATGFGATAEQAGAWLGSLCIGMSILTIYFSIKFKIPVLMAWSTPGGVLLVAASSDFSLKEAIGAFLFSSFLVFLFGITKWFEKIMDRISISLVSALLAGVLLHFCLDVVKLVPANGILVASMFISYVFGRKYLPHFVMLFVLTSGLIVSISLGLFHPQFLDIVPTQFIPSAPEFSFSSLVSIGIPLFIVTMASQNMTGIAVLKSFQYKVPVSPVLTGAGLMGIISGFFGGFAINYAAITAAIAMGPEAHPQRDKRYVAAIVSGFMYIIIGFFAGTITSFFSALPKAMISVIAGLALLRTVAASLEKSFENGSEKEASFITFLIAASGISLFGISSAFWAIVIGLATQTLSNKIKFKGSKS